MTHIGPWPSGWIVDRLGRPRRTDPLGQPTQTWRRGMNRLLVGVGFASREVIARRPFGLGLGIANQLRGQTRAGSDLGRLYKCLDGAAVKVVILAGGVGSRLADQTEAGPKPMVEIGGHPILWHIMRHYVHYGFDEFVVAVGYKGDQIKRYLMDYHTSQRDVRINVGSGWSTS